MDDPRDGIRTIDIGRLVWPCRWIKWTHVALLGAVVTLPTSVLSALLQRDAVALAGHSALLLLLAFPGYLAWRNINVVHSLGQRFTIRSLLLCGLVAALVGLLALLAALQAQSEDEQVASAIVGVLIAASAVVPLLAAWSVHRLRRRSVQGLGVRLATVVAELSAHESPAPRRQLVPQRPVLAWMLIGLAAAIWLGVDFLPETLFKADQRLRIGGQLSQLGFALVLLARAFFQPTAGSLLAGDPRPPVLLLRSFIDDEKLNWGMANRSFVDTSLESRLATHFARFGPFVAVGTPAGGMPVIGAARAQLGDAEWQQQVIRWIESSGHVVMLAGLTDWVEWELRQVIALRAVDKLIVCFPPVGSRRWPDKSLRDFGANMEARLARLRAAFIDTPWAPALVRLSDAKTLRGLRFAPGGRIDVVRAPSRDWNACHLAVLVVQWLMLRERGPAPAAAPDLAVDAPASARLRRGFGVAAGAAFVLAAAATAIGAAGTAWGPVLYPLAAGLALLAPVAGVAVSQPRPSRPTVVASGLAGLVATGLLLHGALVFGLTWAGEVQWGKARAEGGSAAVAMALLRYPARAGLLEAQYHLGLFHLVGQGVARDPQQGCRWLGEPARADFADAAAMYGSCLLDHAIEPRPGESAVDFLERGAAAGSTAASGTLGELYLAGSLVPRDLPRAIVHLERAATAGDADAALRLGLLYLGEESGTPQFDKARAQFELADRGDRTEASYRLGLLLLGGLGGPVDLPRAARCLERAWQAGHGGAGVFYALMLNEGAGGLTRDPQRARAMFDEALRSSDEQVRQLAQDNLAALR